MNKKCSVLFWEKCTSANSPHLFLDAIVLYKELHSSLLESILWWWPHPFRFCGIVVGSSLFSLKSRLWLSFMSGCSTDFVHLWFCLGLSWSCRSCTDSYIPILSFFFSFFFCSLSLKLPTFSVGYSSCLWLRFQSFTSGFRGVSVFFCFIWVYYHKEILMGQAEIKTRGTGSFKSVTI